MATEMPARARAIRAARADDERWQRMWSHREHLLRVARRRSMSMEDAEDAVHEALLRAAERPDLDDERLAAWLTRVTMRLCVDRHRQVSREAEVRTSPRLVSPGPVPVDEAVCDRAEARWIAVRSGELPARQAEALRLKSEDLDVGQVAVRMGLSYRTVESLLARARRTLRNSLSATLGCVLFLLGRARLRAAGKAPAVAAASTVATVVATLGFVVPHTLDEGAPRVSARLSAPRVSVPTTTEAHRRVDSVPTVNSPVPSATSTAPSTTPSPSPSPSDRNLLHRLLPLSVPPLPKPSLSAAVPSLPHLPHLPRVSHLPSVPAVTSVVPTTPPRLPKAPAATPTPPAVP